MRPSCPIECRRVDAVVAGRRQAVDLDCCCSRSLVLGLVFDAVGPRQPLTTMIRTLFGFAVDLTKMKMMTLIDRYC